MADIIRQCPWCRRDRYNDHSPDCVPDVSLLYRGHGVPVGTYTDDFYFDIDTNMIYFNNGTNWIQWGLAGPINGNYNLESNNIINGGTYNDVTVESHASRHLPGGSDPLTTAAPLANLTTNTTNNIGLAESFARSDHSHDISTGVPSTQIPNQTNDVGTSDNFARADHIHNIPTAEPVSIGNTNSQGIATSFAQSDHVHQGIHSVNANGGTVVYGDVTLQSGIGLSIVENNGIFTFNSNDAADDFLVTSGPGLNADYTSGRSNINGAIYNILAGSIALTASTSNGTIYIDTNGVISQSTSTSFNPNVIPLATYSTDSLTITSITDSRVFINNNVIFGNAANISNITATASASGGITNTYAMADHIHTISTGVASTQTPDQVNSVGVSGNLARADHIHEIPTAASITQNPNQTNAIGVATTFARSDHIHNIPTAAPVSIGSANSQGVATTFAQSDHVHEGIHSLKVESGGTARFGDIAYIAGENMTITDDGSGNFNFASSSGNSNLSWTSVTGTGSVIQGIANTGYMNNSTTTQLQVLLPANPVINTRIAIGDIGGGWQLTQNASQNIIFNNLKNDYPFAVNFTTTATAQNWSSVAVSSNFIKQVATVNGGFIYTSIDSGVTWAVRQNDVTRAWNSVASSSDGTRLVASVSAGQIWMSIDSGVTWTQLTGSGKPTNGSASAWVGVTSSENGNVLAAACNAGRIWISSNSGTTWTSKASNKSWSAVASCLDGSKLVATVNGGQIWCSIDSGNTWTAENFNRAWTSVSSSADGNVLAATVTGGYIYISRDSGVSWSGFASISDWKCISVSQDGSRILIGQGTGGYLYSYTFADGNWLQLTNNGTANWSGIACSFDGNKWIACSNTSSGKLIISTNHTTPGIIGSITGGSNSTLDLLCVATNTYMALTSTGIIAPT